MNWLDPVGKLEFLAGCFIAAKGHDPGGELKKYTVTGNICETDTFAEDRMLNEIREGDYLVFRNAGAYGYEMASNYNSRFRPAEVLVLDGKAHLIRKREEMDDLLRNQLEVL